MANVEARGCSAKLWDPGSPGWQWGTAVGLFYSLSIPWHTGPSLLLWCSLFICHPTCFPSRVSAVLMMPELRSLCGLGAAISLVGLLLIANPIPRAPRPKWTCLVPSSCWQPGQWLFFQGQKAVLCLCPVAHTHRGPGLSGSNALPFPLQPPKLHNWLLPLRCLQLLFHVRNLCPEGPYHLHWMAIRSMGCQGRQPVWLGV